MDWGHQESNPTRPWQGGSQKRCPCPAGVTGAQRREKTRRSTFQELAAERNVYNQVERTDYSQSSFKCLGITEQAKDGPSKKSCTVHYGFDHRQQDGVAAYNGITIHFIGMPQ